MSDAPVWDEAIATDLVGGLVVIGITYLRHDNELERQVQTFGIVTAAGRNAGIVIEIHGETWKGQTITLPPSTDAFTRAAPGEYRLRSTGEVVVDPDFTSSWTIAKGPDG